jgi:hypothetical protein
MLDWQVVTGACPGLTVAIPGMQVRHATALRQRLIEQNRKSAARTVPDVHSHTRIRVGERFKDVQASTSCPAIECAAGPRPLATYATRFAHACGDTHRVLVTICDNFALVEHSCDRNAN